MPHIIIEHSKDILAIEELFKKIPEILESHKEGNFALEACKARAISFDKYMVGSKNQDNSAFLHVSVKILEGRSLEVKTKVAKEIADYITKFLKQQNLKKERVDLSVDLIDMTKETYQKITL